MNTLGVYSFSNQSSLFVMGHLRSISLRILLCGLLPLLLSFRILFIFTTDKAHVHDSYQLEFLPSVHHQCGVLLFYHIACTGGASINRWLGKLKDHNANVTYWTKWGRQDGIQDGFIAGMYDQIRSLKSYHWKIVHAHGHSLFPNASEAHLYHWRRNVEHMGCKFVMLTILREAMGHSVSQTKGTVNSNTSIDQWLWHLEAENRNQRGVWNTQIDYLLYNRGPRNVHNATREEKVRRAVQLLQRHFDVVVLGDHEEFQTRVLEITGWERVPMRHSNRYEGELRFTEGELKKMKRLIDENGDVLFIDAVKHLYYGHLQYLL